MGHSDAGEHGDLSPSRFRHLFKQETGTSPAQYLKDFRLRKAEKMLRTTFLSVKQILKQVGIAFEQSLRARFQEDTRHDTDCVSQGDLACGESKEDAKTEVVATFGKI